VDWPLVIVGTGRGLARNRCRDWPVVTVGTGRSRCRDWPVVAVGTVVTVGTGYGVDDRRVRV
jgi:hypothetical protein